MPEPKVLSCLNWFLLQWNQLQYHQDERLKKNRQLLMRFKCLFMASSSSEVCSLTDYQTESQRIQSKTLSNSLNFEKNKAIPLLFLENLRKKKTTVKSERDFTGNRLGTYIHSSAVIMILGKK